MMNDKLFLYVDSNMSIYCYITANDENETLILGFMSSLNHSWDNECFYSIDCDSDTEKGFDDKFHEIYESLKIFNIGLVNGDNLNMEYNVNKNDIKKVKSYLRVKF